jgi:hypothetical protein
VEPPKTLTAPKSAWSAGILLPADHAEYADERRLRNKKSFFIRVPQRFQKRPENERF